MRVLVFHPDQNKGQHYSFDTPNEYSLWDTSIRDVIISEEWKNGVGSNKYPYNPFARLLSLQFVSISWKLWIIRNTGRFSLRTICRKRFTYTGGLSKKKTHPPTIWLNTKVHKIPCVKPCVFFSVVHNMLFHNINLTTKLLSLLRRRLTIISSTGCFHNLLTQFKLFSWQKLI